MKQKFKRKFLQDLVYDDCDDVIAEKIEDNIVAHERWSVVHEMIFKTGGKYYSTTYSVGATESQDESAYEYASDLVECTEVEKKEVTVTKYVKK